MSASAMGMRCAAHMVAQYTRVLVTAALALGAARPRLCGKNATAATRRVWPELDGRARRVSRCATGLELGGCQRETLVGPDRGVLEVEVEHPQSSHAILIALSSESASVFSRKKGDEGK